MPEAVLSDAQSLIIREAEAARSAAEGKPYVHGGSTKDGFDCSGFVIYVFNRAYGTNTLPRVTADDLRTGGRFPAVDAPGVPGDLVFFSPTGSGTRATHVGIVVNAAKWIGSQTSTGVAYVTFSNAYWRPRVFSYGRYKPLESAAAIIPMRAGYFASTINA